MESPIAALVVEYKSGPARGVEEKPPLLYDVRNSAPSQTSNSKLLERFIHPVDVCEPREVELHQPDGSVRVRRLFAKLRHLPTEILYDNEGLELFEQITQLDAEYYLTGCERDVLTHHMRDIANHIPNHSSIVELGCGSMSKTAIILDNLRSSGKQGISFYALDIEESFLKASLNTLVEDEKKKRVPAENVIKYAGILGSYDQALQSILGKIKSRRVFLWLGSSLGNCPSRKDAAELLQRFQKVMETGDLFLIGIDKRNEPSVVARAYNDAGGVTAAFGLNGLKHLNELLDEETFPIEKFDYFAGYNEVEGRHEAYFRSLEDQTLSIPSTHSPDGHESVHLEKNELVRYEMSYKYSLEEIQELGVGSGLSLKDSWLDSKGLYRLCLFEQKRTFSGELGKSGIPSLQDFKEAWSQWDRVSGPGTIMDYAHKPIHLRHPIIFYVGHLPTFCDILVSTCLNEELTEPKHYKTIFERGIDPDVEDPNTCHPHSEVPETWPALEEILEYQGRVRQRVMRVFEAMERGEISVPHRRLGRVLHMVLDHETMHIETFMYMLVQSHKIKPPSEKPAFTVPHSQLAPPKWVNVKGGEVRIGVDDDEALDMVRGEAPDVLGWDNETPAQLISVPSFEIQHRPVTNLEYLCFMKLQPFISSELIPGSFAGLDESGMYAVKTVFGEIPVTQCMNWPVALNYHQATAYMNHLQSMLKDDSIHIPTEAEWVQFFEQRKTTLDPSHVNVGFQNWSPTDLSDEEVHVCGSLWEWTSTVLEKHPGFIPSEIYPGFTNDFFDGKHQVVKGGSWATHPRQVGKLRNFYQRSYCFSFTGVRFARSLTE